MELILSAHTPSSSSISFSLGFILFSVGVFIPVEPVANYYDDDDDDDVDDARSLNFTFTFTCMLMLMLILMFMFMFLRSCLHEVTISILLLGQCLCIPYTGYEETSLLHTRVSCFDME